MFHKYWVLLFIAVLAPAAFYAQKQSKAIAAGALLSSKDTVLLIVQHNQKIVLHEVKPKQTLFAITKYYGITMEELYAYNPEYQIQTTLQPDALIKIPVPNKAIRRYKGEEFKKELYAPIYYVVSQGENLYGICKRHFNMPVDTILKRNGLKNQSIRPGQLLHMGWFNINGIPPEWQPSEQPEASIDSSALADNYLRQKEKYKEVGTQGVCFWHRDSNEKGNLYALHNSAALGTVMAVTNPMSNRTVYAKVIGRIPAGHDRNIELILSPEAARRLGARDPRFFVKIKYLYQE